MAFFVIIRGPLGIGKTTVSEALAKAIGAECISIDRILDVQGLWETGRVSEFLHANEFAAPQARRLLVKGTPVIFDGNFYWKPQIEDLVRRLGCVHYIFTLRAPLAVCVDRDSRRIAPHGPKAAEEVFAKSTAFEYGIEIDGTASVEAVVREIVSHLR